MPEQVLPTWGQSIGGGIQGGFENYMTARARARQERIADTTLAMQYEKIRREGGMEDLKFTGETGMDPAMLREGLAATRGGAQAGPEASPAVNLFAEYQSKSGQAADRNIRKSVTVTDDMVTQYPTLTAGSEIPSTFLTEMEFKREKEANKPVKNTIGQDAVDRNFGKEYADYVAGGGFADTKMQLESLSGVAGRLESGRENLTGPFLGASPEFIRKRTHPESVAAQQLVEQSVQRTLKKTLGGQFTEREGVLFMERGYDPALPEKENAKKLRIAIKQLSEMAEAKERAVKYWEKNGTLKGFSGNIFTLRNGEIVIANASEAEKIMQSAPQDSGASAPIPVWDDGKERRYQELKRRLGR